MLRSEVKVMGDLSLSMYHFEEVGDELLKHTHGFEDVHISIVTKGSIKAYSHDWEVVVPAGKVMDFKPFQPHGFIALEPDTKMIGIPKLFPETAAKLIAEREKETEDAADQAPV